MSSTRNSGSAGPFFYSICDDNCREEDLFVFELPVDLFTVESMLELKGIQDLKHHGVLLDDFLKKTERHKGLTNLRVVDWQALAEYEYSDRVATLRIGSTGTTGTWSATKKPEHNQVVQRWVLWDHNGVPRASIPYVGPK